jgi:hypothetical protein
MRTQEQLPELATVKYIFCVLHCFTTALGEGSNILMSKFPSDFVIRGWLVVCFFLVLRKGNVKAIYKTTI